MSSTASVGGLISGIDTNSMLDKLYEISQAPIKRMQARQDTLRARSAAWSMLEAQLLSFRTSALPLANGSGFRVQRAAVNRPDLVAATASSDAVPGSYTFSVEKLAQSHQVVSQGFADTTQVEVGSGTISIKLGDGDATVIAVDGFTLAELRDAINAADPGVSAAIVNDGSSSPYRLVLTSKTGGLAGHMQVETSLNGGTTPTFNDLQAAQDAEIKLGSGAGAITVTSSSNRVEGAIPGVTIDLLGADPGALVSITLSRDTAAIQSRIGDFVETYNAIVHFFAEQFHYDPETDQSGALFADRRLESLQRDLGAAIGEQVIGLAGGSRALADIGVRTLSDGTLSIDSAALAIALSDRPDEVASVFAAAGQTSNPMVTYLTATTDTTASGTAGWAVDITQAATPSRVTAGAAQTASLDADEALTIRGVTITLTAEMTQADVIAAINEHQDETGVAASATGADGSGAGSYLTLTRAAYGAAYHVDATSTRSNQTGNSSGIGSLAVSDENPVGEGGLGMGAAGQDVQGTIGGEAATGSGQRLTGSAGPSKGLALLVTADAPGAYGTAIFTVGAAEAAFRAALWATDSTSGTIAAAQTEITDLVGDMDQEIGRLQATVDQENERMKAAFARMERALGQYQAQSEYLAGQIEQMQRSAPGAT